MRLSRSTIETPLGDMLVLASDAGLCALEFTGPLRGKSEARSQKSEAKTTNFRLHTSDLPGSRLPRLDARLARWFPPHEIVDRDVSVFARTRAWLAAYFTGSAADAGGLPLDMRGAAFEKRVWAALRRIPPGETTSYGAIARDLGAPGASRAVGAA